MHRHLPYAQAPETAQQHLALLACYVALGRQRGKVSTGNVYAVYQELCTAQNCRALSQRRFSDMVSFLDLYGLVNAPVISKGRFGKTREVSSALPRRLLRPR